MKKLHRSDLFSWSRFDESRNIDFHSVAWIRDGGNVLIDPLPLSLHDEAHLLSLGGARLIIITNSDHVRGSAALADRLGAKILGPHAERAAFPVACDEWLKDGDGPVEGLEVLVFGGSKTAGELALLIDGTTLVTGDLIRADRAGSLNLLPDAKLSDRAVAIRSTERIADIESLEAVLVGDGWPVFRDARRLLAELLNSLRK